MKCPVCNIEMIRETADRWVCRNKKCIKYGKGADEKKWQEPIKH